MARAPSADGAGRLLAALALVASGCTSDGPPPHGHPRSYREFTRPAVVDTAQQSSIDGSIVAKSDSSADPPDADGVDGTSDVSVVRLDATPDVTLVDAPLVITVEIGVPDPTNSIDFRALPVGGDIPLISSGQAGLLMSLGLRARNLGDAAFIEGTVTATRDGGGTATRPATLDPLPLNCQPDGWCLRVPYSVAANALADTVFELDGLRVEIMVTMSNETGDSQTATATGVLRRR